MNIDMIFNKDNYSIDSTTQKILEFLKQYHFEDVFKLFSYTTIRLNIG